MNRIQELRIEILGEEEIIANSNREEQWPVQMENLAQYIDHTILKPEANNEAIINICQEAELYKFRSVCVNPVNAALAKKHLPTVDLCCVVGFPLGQNATEIKVAETRLAIENGANEIDMVINVGWLKSKEYKKVYKDIKAICEVCHQGGAILKVIIETCLLSDDEKIIACLLAVQADADFVKTSTGFSSGGATLEDIALMRKVVGNKIGVKASGGIRDREKAIAMLEAGANRIGASSSIKIINK